MSENAKKEPYIVRVPVRGIMSMTFPSETSCRLQWMFYGKEEER